VCKGEQEVGKECEGFSRNCGRSEGSEGSGLGVLVDQQELGQEYKVSAGNGQECEDSAGSGAGA